MLLNYLKIAIRNIRKNKFFSVISILGLAVGIAVAIMAGMYAINELSFDKFNPHYDNIYRIEAGDWFHVPAPLIPIIKSEMTGLESVAPIDRQSLSVQIDEEELGISNTIFTTADFLNVFPIKMIDGEAESALNEPDKIIISKSAAEKLFGSTEIVGRAITVNETFNFTITGIFQDFPDNSILYFNALSCWQNRKTMTGQEDYFDSWSNWNYQTFIRLSEGTSSQETIELFNKSFNEIMSETDPDRSDVEFDFRHLKDIFFFEGLNKNDNCRHGNMQYLVLFTSSALLTLIIAIINFINLTTARANLRSAEIGIRKVNGAGRSDLIKQFLGESFIISIISFLISFLLIELFLPSFNQIIGKDLVFNPVSSILSVLLVLIGIVFITLLTGFYPAFLMSSFNTIFVLKKETFKGRSGLLSRRILMIIQFVITISLLLGTLIIFSQMKFMVNKDLGYDKEHILYFWMNSDLKKHEQMLKQNLLKSTEINKVSIVHSLPGNMRMEWGRNLEDGTSVNFFSVPCDEDFIPMLDLEIVEGRSFDPKLESDKYSYIVNQAFIKKYGIQAPLSTMIDDHKIVGVVQNFTFQSLHYNVKPMAFSFFSEWSWCIAVKVQGNAIENSKETIQNICKQFTDKQIYVNFLDDTISAKYVKDKQFSNIFTIFSVLAIFVSSLGLLGLITYEANRRTKEIGIRKVLGASPLEIIALLNKEIVILISISAVIAWTIGYFWLTNWLQNFAFRIDLKIIHFILSGAITVILALITFSTLAFKAANTNPVDSIKYE